MSREWTARDTAYFLPLLIERDGKVCHYCGRAVYLASEIEKNPRSTHERKLAEARKPFRVIISRKVPVSKGGSEFDLSNMVVACFTCSDQKKARFSSKFKEKKKRHNK